MNTAKKINAIILLVMVVLSVPTGAILISADAVPGETFFPLKISIEKIASTILSPSYSARSDLEVKLVQRRIEENQKLLLSSGSTRGLEILIAQAESAKTFILESNISSEKKTEAVRKLVKTLKESKVVLEEQKRTIAATQTIQKQIQNQTIIQSSSPSQGNSPTTTVTTTPPTTTQPPTTPDTQENQGPEDTEESQNPEDVIEDIDNTEDELEEIIEELLEEEENGEGESAEEEFEEEEEEPTPPEASSCEESCSNQGYENGGCLPERPCTNNGGTINSSGNQFCSHNNKICCCK